MATAATAAPAGGGVPGDPGTKPTTEPEDSLFAHEQRQYDDIPWWQRNFLLTKPVLFGTWDGVFTTVMVNIFGIIVFLRMGWIVGTAGIANAILLLIICTTLALISVFSAIGILERCRIQSGGIYFLISHVLGGQIGGAVALMYAFGQAVATGLVAVGFGEGIAKLIGVGDPKITKVIAAGTLLVLTAINTAGVRWVIRLQLLLLFFLAVAVIDFFLGALFTVDEQHGVGHISTHQFDLNSGPMYEGMNCTEVGFDVKQSNESFFTVFGVFFANFLGVLAGVNMSADLKDPQRNIPLGELSAVGVSSTVCFFFIITLGSIVDRDYLLCDSLIAEKVSLTGVLFLAGLYVSTLSSTIGSLLGTPRVIQSIAAEGIIPVLNPLAVGRGANKDPVRAGIVMMLVAVIFVMLGDLNQLAILSTMPFLITYAFVNYSYVSLAMSFDLQTVTNVSATVAEKQSYGSMGNLKAAAEGPSARDLDTLFPERTQQPVDPGDPRSSIIGQPMSWYSMFSNRYISFIGAIINVLILLLVNVWYALLHFLALTALYVYIGRVCPAVFPGISQFSLPHMFKTAFSSIESLGTLPKPGVIIGVRGDAPPGDVTTTALNQENPDYQDRKQYHHAEHSEALGDFD